MCKYYSFWTWGMKFCLLKDFTVIQATTLFHNHVNTHIQTPNSFQMFQKFLISNPMYIHKSRPFHNPWCRSEIVFSASTFWILCLWYWGLINAPKRNRGHRPVKGIFPTEVPVVCVGGRVTWVGGDQGVAGGFVATHGTPSCRVHVQGAWYRDTPL